MSEEQELLELYKNKDIDKLFDKVGEYYHKWLNNSKKLDFYKQERERLDNIINELEEELDRGYRDLFEQELVPGRELITNIKNYLQELKGSDKN